MNEFFKILISISLLFLLGTGCAEDGGLYEEGKKFSVIRTIGLIGGAAIAVQAAKEGGFGGVGGGTQYTGGPHWDWDIFSNGQYRCKDISSGQFVINDLCLSMPLDDDRWPNY